MKLWNIKLSIGSKKFEVVKVENVKGYQIGIAVKRVLDASCPPIGQGNTVTIEVERAS